MKDHSGNSRFASLTYSLLAAALLISNAAPAIAASDKPLAALEHGLRPTVLKPGEPLPGWSLQERMAHYHVPGVAIAVLTNGEVVAAAGYGVRGAGTHDAVDANTLFSAGSVSKVITAATSLRLVAQGKIDLDRDVNSYLKSWQIPPAPGIANPTVTTRMLLSHTAGLTVHGFDDYLPAEALPTLVQTLNGTAPAKNAPVRLQREPGLLQDYSGGGIMVAQQMIEDIAGAPLETVARAQVFDPIGMRRSTFENPLSATRGNIAKAHDDKGTPTALPRGWQTFPEQGASGLWTSANELGRFVGALIKSYQGKGDFLPQAIAQQMMSEVAPSQHGLGPRLAGEGVTRIFHHGGANDSYLTWTEGYLETGDGLVVLTNGPQGDELFTEIRNAFSDAFGHGVNPLIRTAALDLRASTYAAGYAGAYRADTGVPMDHRGELTDYFNYDSLDVKVVDGAVTVWLPKRDKPMELLPLSPTRFTNPRGTLKVEFHRDTHGAVRGLSVSAGSSRAYYRHQAPALTSVR